MSINNSTPISFKRNERLSQKIDENNSLLNGAAIGGATGFGVGSIGTIVKKRIDDINDYKKAEKDIINLRNKTIEFVQQNIELKSEIEKYHELHPIKTLIAKIPISDYLKHGLKHGVLIGAAGLFGGFAVGLIKNHLNKDNYNKQD